MSHYQALNKAAKYALAYVDELSFRRVFPTKVDLKELQRFSEVLPEQSTDPQEVIRQLHEFGSRNTVASNSGRYFGFVFGGTLPALMAAAWMASPWDQNAFFTISSPVSAHLEDLAGRWLLDLLQLPEKSAVKCRDGQDRLKHGRLCNPWDEQASSILLKPTVPTPAGLLRILQRRAFAF